MDRRSSKKGHGNYLSASSKFIYTLFFFIVENYDCEGAPVGLREQKQRKQRGVIIENAIALFRESGFAPVRVREIAIRCEISDATFFNYFESKEALLGEWAHSQVDAAFREAGQQAAESGQRRLARAAVRGLADLARREPELMREAWLRARVLPTAGRHRGRAVDGDRDPVRLPIERAQARGEVRTDLPAEQLAQLLRASIATSLAHALDQTDLDVDESITDRLARATDVLLDAFRKRNERIRPGAAARAPAPPA